MPSRNVNTSCRVVGRCAGTLERLAVGDEVKAVLGDPHSPNLHAPGFRGRARGLGHAHFGWMLSHPMPNPLRYAGDILRDPRLIHCEPRNLRNKRSALC